MHKCTFYTALKFLDSAFSPFAKLFKWQRIKEDSRLASTVDRHFLCCLPHLPQEGYNFTPHISKTDLEHELMVHPVCQKVKTTVFIGMSL
jgi:hypothetical protein